MRLRDLRQEQASVAKSAEQFRRYQSSPYFGRLDLDTESEDESAIYYIGKEGISDSAKVIVVDWRTPIGSCYYASNQKEFHVNGTKYLLALRRALDVRNGVLVSYRTEYDGETISLEGDVIDPFLLTVLKDKRRHNRLTDIIRTIQGNQNEIIRRPRTESFVVQGCAGSGKTIMAEAYIDVANPEKRERINYLTNSFSNGGLPVLITTHNVGKNLSNPRIRFIIHYDMPAGEQLHHLHISQIGQLAENPTVYDLYVL